MAVLLPNGKQYYIDTSTGLPLVGGKVYTYAAGTSTPKATYTTAAGTVSNANPVILDSRGEATIFWDGAYKIVVKDSSDNLIWEIDNVDTTIDITDITYNGVSLSSLLQSSLQTVVDSITDLKAVDSAVYTKAYVTGYYAIGDGGGGDYYYDSTDITTADNGGSVIVANDGARWKLLTQGKPYSVLQFGAKPDYTTDATAAIQAAIDALSTAGGIVTIDGSFLITDITINAGVTLLGNNGAPSQSATGTYGPTTAQSVLVMSSADTITMKAGARLQGVIVLESDLAPGATYALPLTSANAAAAVANFAGTAITPYADSYDMEIVDCMLLGFEYGVKTGAGANHYAMMLDHVFIDCTHGTYIYSGFQTDVSILRDCRCEPFLTDHLNDSAKDARTGTAFYDATTRISYTDCRQREWAIGFHSANSSAHHLACSSYNYAAANSKIGFKYTGGGLFVFNTDCTVWNCGGGGIYSDLPVLAGERTGITIQGLDAYNASPCVAADGLIYIVDGYYTITDSQFGNNTGYGAIKLGANADSGSIANVSFYATTALPPVYGDAAALLLCRFGTLLYRDTSPTVQPLTWTPVIKLGATAQTGLTAYGHFTITNQHVTAYFDITMTSESGTGNVTITGLPYTAANETDSMLGMGCIPYYENVNGLAGAIGATVAKNTAIIDLWQRAASGVTALTHTETTATTRLVGWVTYRI